MILPQSQNNSTTVFKIVIISALLITIGRIASPFEVGKDQSSQLEAAQRLVDGKGLTTTNDVSPVSFDITQNPQPKPLTWWPPGFSLLMAGLLFTGLPLLVALKSVFAVMTIVGWLGWAILASHFLSQPLTFFGRSIPLHYLIAALLPIFCTPWWGGTDIFLWAGIPFFFFILIKTGAEHAARWAILAGLLFGMLYSFRYASVFLGFTAFLIILLVNFPNIKHLITNGVSFALSSLLFIVPISIYNHQAQSVMVAAPSEDMGLVSHAPTFLESIEGVFRSLPMVSNLIFGFPIVEQVVYKFNSILVEYVAGIVCLLILLAIPLVLLKYRNPETQNYIELSFSFLPLSLVAFLSALYLFGFGDFMGVRRYYEPIGLCCMFIFYEIAGKNVLNNFFKTAAKGFVTLFVLYVLIFLPVLAFVPQRGDFVVSLVLGYMPANNLRYRSTSLNISFPENVLFSNKEKSRQKLKELHEANPQAIFFIQEYGYFIYDGFQDGPSPGNLLRVWHRKEFWERAYTSKPVKVFWVIENNTKVDFLPTQEQKIVFQDPYERTKIIAFDFPEGQLFPLTQANSLNEEKQTEKQ